jgi:hypothetical protein
LGALLHLADTGFDPGAEPIGGAASVVRQVIERCLHEDPRARYESMHELDADLARVQEPA